MQTWGNASGAEMNEEMTDMSSKVSRRNFIKGVIAAGATVSWATYLFRAK